VKKEFASVSNLVFDVVPKYLFNTVLDKIRCFKRTKPNKFTKTSYSTTSKRSTCVYRKNL